MLVLGNKPFHLYLQIFSSAKSPWEYHSTEFVCSQGSQVLDVAAGDPGRLLEDISESEIGTVNKPYNSMDACIYAQLKLNP